MKHFFEAREKAILEDSSYSMQLRVSVLHTKQSRTSAQVCAASWNSYAFTTKHVRSDVRSGSFVVSLGPLFFGGILAPGS